MLSDGTHEMMPQFVLSLFPGIGLLDHAFDLEGFTVVRGPDPIWGGDIRNWHLPAGKFDGVIGGPPCQSFSSLSHLVRANGNEPIFGNLIPEFERCVAESLPDWFIMEEVPQAPVAVVPGYSVHPFLLNNAWLAGEDGFGQEQERKRMFSFGVCSRLGLTSPNLMKFIDLCTLMLPKAGTVTQWTPNNTPAAKKRHEAITGGHDRTPSRRTAQATVTSNVGGKRVPCVVAMQGGQSKRGGNGKIAARRYTIPDALRLQGLPENYLEHCPMTKEGQLKAIANGVPIPMGRALARAIREWLETL